MPDDSMEKLAVIMASTCVRRTCIEQYHTEGKLSDAEMKAFNKEVADRLYTFLKMYAGPHDEEWDVFIGEMAKLADTEVRTWDKPKFLTEMWPGMGNPNDPRFSPEEGQIMAFIMVHADIEKKAPSEAELQRLLNLPAAAVSRMVSDLEKRGLVQRTPDQVPRVEVLLRRGELPRLKG